MIESRDLGVPSVPVMNGVNANLPMEVLYSLFDRMQAEAILRSKLANAKAGFFNGSVPPFGYRTTEVFEEWWCCCKKRLTVDHEEAVIVRQIFDQYLCGEQNGKILPFTAIASFLNRHGIRLRGRSWTGRSIRRILENSVYIGKYIFNKYDSKTRKLKPESKWVSVDVEPIVNPEVFAAVQESLLNAKVEKEK